MRSTETGGYSSVQLENTAVQFSLGTTQGHAHPDQHTHVPTKQPSSTPNCTWPLQEPGRETQPHSLLPSSDGSAGDTLLPAPQPQPGFVPPVPSFLVMFGKSRAVLCCPHCTALPPKQLQGMPAAAHSTGGAEGCWHRALMHNPSTPEAKQ